MKTATEFLFWNPQYYLVIMPVLLFSGMYIGNKIYKYLYE